MATLPPASGWNSVRWPSSRRRRPRELGVAGANAIVSGLRARHHKTGLDALAAEVAITKAEAATVTASKRRTTIPTSQAIESPEPSGTADPEAADGTYCIECAQTTAAGARGCLAGTREWKPRMPGSCRRVRAGSQQFGTAWSTGGVPMTLPEIWPLLKKASADALLAVPQSRGDSLPQRAPPRPP